MGRMHQGVYNVREFQKLLADNGFEFVRQAGNHRIYRRGSETISMPTHSVKQTTLYDIIKQHRLQRRNEL